MLPVGAVEPLWPTGRDGPLGLGVLITASQYVEIKKCCPATQGLIPSLQPGALGVH